ncbi:acyltransferase family protein [Blautia sp.]|jgi:surface polysaccharide O-acyltransferase-like enzyme|uniref:acyltransferase family protein n=1 Tax=Blautia sp. TaxID=1955243 RepID=UPI003D8B4926
MSNAVKIRSNTRKSGIELLRIFTILMVISVHRMGHQTLYSAPQFSISYYVLWFIEIAGYKAVDIFFIISGYFGITQRFRGKKLLIMELKVFVYCVGFYLLSVAVNYQVFNARDFLRACLPYLGGHYWYYTAYISLILISPWLNKMVFAIDKKKLLLLILLITGVSAFSIGDAFFTADGYSVFWAVNLYLIGAYIRLYYKSMMPPRKAFCCSFACTIFIFLWFVVVGRITQYIFGHEVFSTHFMVYRQLPVVLGGVFAVIAFVQIDFKGMIGKVINSVSKCTFGVYLIHSCVFMDTLFWIKLFPANAASQKEWYWLYVVGSIVAMYITCLIIESVRNLLFAPIEKSNIFDLLAKKIGNIVRTIVDRVAKIGEKEK